MRMTGCQPDNVFQCVTRNCSLSRQPAGWQLHTVHASRVLKLTSQACIESNLSSTCAFWTDVNEASEPSCF
eukprot:scaffold3092_cov153-Skeletonema_marinoi.AAC.5